MKKYNEFSREDLIKKIKEDEYIIDELKKEKNEEELLNYPWVGNLGHWYWNIQTNDVISNDKKITTLNYTVDEIPEDLGFEFFTSKLHPDDYERVMDNMRQHLYGNSEVYEVEYRIQTKDGDYKWYYDIGKVTRRDEENKPLFVSGIVFNITEKKNMELIIRNQNEKLLEAVNLDHLTKTLNRKALYEKLESEIHIVDKSQSKLSIVMIDIDKFKRVNDNYGHQVGDSVIKKIAEIIKNSLPEESFVGRYGGEEYLVIIPGRDKEQAYIVAENIRKNIEDTEFIYGIKITVSGGVSEYDNKQSLDVLVYESDKNLYKAKNSGRNKIT